MFHSAATKLTAWYLAIIMALSIGLSFALYNVSSHDLASNIRRQNDFFNFLTPQDMRMLNQQRRLQLADSQQHLRFRLVGFNLVVLLVGGGLSYALARRTLQPLETSLKNQSRFTGDAAHELRTPLTAMQTEIEVALRDPKLDKSKAAAQLNSNLEEIAKLRNLTDGLLALANDNDVPQLNRLSLKLAAQNALKQVRPVLTAKKIKVKSDLADLRVKGDKTQLENLIVILLDNAVKYSQPGTQVKITLARRDKSACLTVKDQGIGIKPEEIKQIFERFYRADNSRSKITAEGYGLGLAIAKQIVERHHGYVEVSSLPGKGSTFTITLPLDG